MKWQEEFKKKFNPIYSGDMSGGYDAMPYLLEYIESLLEEQRKELEASIRKEVVESLLVKLDYWKNKYNIENPNEEQIATGYSQGLDEFSLYLQELSKGIDISK